MCVKLTRDAVVILAFAEELSLWVIGYAQEYQVRVLSASVLQKCQARVPKKSVKSECPTRVSSKSVLQKCQVKVS